MTELGNVAQWASVAVAALSVCIAAASFVFALRASKSKRHEEAMDKLKAAEAEQRVALKTELSNTVGGLGLDVRAVKADVSRAFERIDQTEQHYAEIRNELKHLPDKDSVHKLELSNSRIEGKVDRLFERVEPIRNIAWRLQEDALDQARATAKTGVAG